jgi:2'-5' RNA ligase
VRLFLALDAGSSRIEKEKLKKLKIGLDKKSIEHRFVSEEQYHITLVNFGDMDDIEYEDKDIYIKNIIQEHNCFDLKLSGVWAYPNPNEGRILWVGVQNSKELRSLQEDLVAQIPSICALDFKPTMPLVRMRNHHNVVDIISPYKTLDFGKLKVNSVILYEMTSGGAYPVLKKLKTYYLGPGLNLGD